MLSHCGLRTESEGQKHANKPFFVSFINIAHIVIPTFSHENMRKSGSAPRSSLFWVQKDSRQSTFCLNLEQTSLLAN